MGCVKRNEFLLTLQSFFSVIRSLCFLIGAHQTQAHQTYPPTETGKDAIFCDEYISKRCFLVLDKRHTVGNKADKRLGEDLYTFQIGRGVIYNHTFSKVNIIRKGTSGTYNWKKKICVIQSS